MENEMSKIFQQPHGMTQYNNEEAIRLYNEELNTHPDNYAALNNRGCCKMQLAIKKKDAALLEEAKNDFRKAISSATEQDAGPNYSAEYNLKKADSTDL